MTAFVIPVKRLFQAKTRLSGVCTPDERQSLCLEMLRHMLRTAGDCPLLDLSAVVSPDEHLRDLLSEEFPAVRFSPDPGDSERRRPWPPPAPWRRRASPPCSLPLGTCLCSPPVSWNRPF